MGKVRCLMVGLESCRGRLIDFSNDHIVKEGRYGYLVYSVSDHHNTSVSCFTLQKRIFPKGFQCTGQGKRERVPSRYCMVDEAGASKEKHSTKQVSDSRLLELLCRTAETGTNEGSTALVG